MTEEVAFEQIDLKKFRLIAATELTKQLMEDFAIPAELTVRDIPAIGLLDMLVMSIKQEVYGETLGTLETKHSATWFQMLKEQHAPYWLKRRWPIRYTYQIYDARALYPKLALPDEKHNRVWVKKRRWEDE